LPSLKLKIVLPKIFQPFFKVKIVLPKIFLPSLKVKIVLSKIFLPSFKLEIVLSGLFKRFFKVKDCPYLAGRLEISTGVKECHPVMTTLAAGKILKIIVKIKNGLSL
jgi:hypothetical protein